MCTGLGGLWMIPCLLHHFVSPHCHKVVDIFLWIALLILPHIHPSLLPAVTLHGVSPPCKRGRSLNTCWTLIDLTDFAIFYPPSIKYLAGRFPWLVELGNTRSHTLKTPLPLSLSQLNFTQVASCHGFLYHAIPLLPGLPSSFQPASHTAITRHCIWATSQLKSTQTGRQSHH